MPIRMVFINPVTYSKLNEFSGIDVVIAFYVILMGRQRRVMGLNTPLAMPLMRDPGA